MQGNETMLFQYMEGSSKRFIIPVYQRNYDWKIEQCKTLYDDLIKVHKENRKTHFFGSIVSSRDDQLGMQEYLIIDGQQRLTTVSLMLLALHNLIVEGKVKVEIKTLPEKIKNEFLIDKYDEEATRIKLKPVKDDAKAFMALIENGEDHIKASNITINYNYFYNRILKKEISGEDLYNAFCRLQIINIFLGSEDNPQLIFESLNSTGLDLSEGDKIRNYILMDVKPTKLQEKYYEKYWHKIEQYTNYDVSSFVRDYLSIKMQSTPAMKKVYLKFKEFMDTNPFNNPNKTENLEDREMLMEDLLSYAKRYEILLKANSSNKELNTIIERLNRFEATVTRPFLMEVIRHSEDENHETSKLSQNELLKIFEIVESYIFRRQICDIPTNALNKVFVALNNEIVRYDGTIENYLEKLKYALMKKTASGIYPDDGMFEEGLSNKQVYLMRSKNKKYIMERFENWGTKEVKDVWNLIEEGTYTIEHIMPQTLSTDWKKELGPDYELIHEEWVDKLANLTLTAYNSRYSNSSFITKRDMKNGFSDSGIRMNQKIAKYKKWTLEELKNRNEYLINRALNIWPMVDTDYEPAEKIMDSITLADEVSMKGRKLSKISFLGVEQSVTSWVDAYIKVISTLHSENPMILFKLATDKSGEGLSNYVAESEEGNSSYSKLEEGIYLWVNTNTDTKLNLLRKLFKIYEFEEEELVFYLSDNNEKNTRDMNSSQKKRMKFWSEALPVFKKETGKFKNVNPSDSNWISTYIGHSGINITTVANLNDIRVELYIGKKDKEINDDIFNFIKESKDFIEIESDQLFVWKNEPENITSRISIEYEGIGISDESNWETCIDFLSKGVNTILKYIVPKVDEYFAEKGI